MKIIESARKHYTKEHLTDEDVLHAVQFYMETIETKSGKTLQITPASVGKSIRQAHKLIKDGLPGAELGAYAIDPISGCIIERDTGKVIGTLNHE